MAEQEGQTPSNWLKPTPTITGETKPFWEAAARSELLIQKCADCKQYQWYPRGLCPICWWSRIAWLKGSGRGKGWTDTMTRQSWARGCQDKTP